MSAVLDYLNLCRLCLVKDKVNIAIFDETNDVRQLFLKISACLPVKVAQDDRLPKKICDSCLYKVDLLYQFWNTTISSEKQLLQWCGGNTGGENVGAGDTLMLPQSHAHPHSIHTETIILKEERPDSADTKSGDGYDGAELSTATATVSASDLYSEEFALTYQQQQQLTEATSNYTSSSAPNQTPKKRPRGRPPGSTKKKRQATRSRARRDSVEDSDDDRPLAAVQEDHLNSAAGLQITKEEAESDEDYVDNTESLEPTTFVAVPSTSACELPGPSGIVTKGGSSTSTSTEQGLANLTWTPLPVITQVLGAVADTTYTCSVCAKQCNDRETLRLHNRSHKERKQACPVCGMKFHYQFEVRKHARRHGDTDGTADTSVECDLCNKRFVNAFSLSVHKRRHTLDYTDRCTECDKGFYTKAECQQHYNVEHKGVRHTCTECNKQFRDVHRYRAHQKLHEAGPQQYKCVECDKVYHQAGNLRRHVRTVHENIGGVYICEVCGKSVGSQTTLRDHMRTHTGERPYTCSTCGKGFKAAIRLKEHTLTHTGERPHVCTTCGKRFTQRSSMVIHMRSHTGERPYPCTICQKEFASRSLMKIHRKVHGTALADI